MYMKINMKNTLLKLKNFMKSARASIQKNKRNIKYSIYFNLIIALIDNNYCLTKKIF